MKRKGVLWGAASLAAAAVVAGAVYVTSHYDVSEASSLGSEAASAAEPARALDFTLTDLEGNHVSMRELRGRTVYLNFWTTWCKYCKKEMPALQKVSEAYKDRNVVVVTVNVGEDRQTALDYIQSHGYPFRVLLDEKKKLTEAYGITSIPVSIIVDPLGNVKHKRVGAMTEAQMREALDPVAQAQ
ncbi:TlpA family protein disulfide reductase [Paenibacillus glycinis]|uniref:Redoxin domain-containing protein n=1 Tax=Paenibacillus glycinis TaxID=2697035 RepID=A0ABW9XXY6_9BACL|nr:TlpA disulfide reductase family protein [Paenibacillus glycinis]NBD27102.1 redoxin domain-containing protein [Paenibacillus glycinis]